MLQWSAGCFSHLLSSNTDLAQSCCSDDIFDDIDGSFNELNNKVSSSVHMSQRVLCTYFDLSKNNSNLSILPASSRIQAHKRNMPNH